MHRRKAWYKPNKCFPQDSLHHFFFMQFSLVYIIIPWTSQLAVGLQSQVIQTAQVWLSFSFVTNVYSNHKRHKKLCKNFHNQWGESLCPICWIVLKKFDLCFAGFFFILQDIFPVFLHYLNVEHIGSILTANSLLWNNSSWCL